MILTSRWVERSDSLLGIGLDEFVVLQRKEEGTVRTRPDHSQSPLNLLATHDEKTSRERRFVSIWESKVNLGWSHFESSMNWKWDLWGREEGSQGRRTSKDRLL